MLEALVTENMKQNIIEATPKFQLGGMPKCRSTELLVILKTWMKMKEEKKENGIFQVFDMTKFFDKESLLDCMTTLKEKAAFLLYMPTISSFHIFMKQNWKKQCFPKLLHKNMKTEKLVFSD